MSPDEVSAVHDRNWIATFSALADALPSGFRAELPTVCVSASGTPIMNRVIVTDPELDPADLARALALVRSRGVPFDVFVRSTYQRALALVEAAGLEPCGRIPCMVDSRPTEAVDGAPDLEVRQVEPRSMTDFHEVARDGFEMPDSLVAAVFRPELLGIVGLRAFVGYADGRPVACSASYSGEDAVGVYTVATIPAARGRGYGTAVTAAAMRTTQTPARVAVMQASEMGQPVYERMGFRTVHEQAIFQDPAPAA